MMERLIGRVLSDDGVSDLARERRDRIEQRQREIDATLKRGQDAMDYLRAEIRLRERADDARG